MNIEGLDYNTNRDRLKLSEYGREIQLMVDHALTIEDRRERQQCAETIVKIMRRVSPPLTNDEDAKNKYWDHLAVMADFKLDIDYPVDLEEARAITMKPQRLEYTTHRVTVRHYGRLVGELLEKLKTMPDNEERRQLVSMTANHMKKCLAEFSHGSDDNEKVASDLAYYTDGKIQLDLDTFRFARVTPQRQGGEKKRKRK